MPDYSREKRTQFILDSLQRFQRETHRESSALNVLDLGCGSGDISRQVAAKGHVVLGLDRSRGRILVAQSKTAIPSCRFEICDIFDIKKFGMKFNTVVLADVIYLIKNVDSVLQIIRDVLTVPGQMILTTHNAHGPYELICRRPFDVGHYILRTMIGRNTAYQREISFYTYDRINGLIAKHGFSVRACQNSDFISFFPYIRISPFAKLDCRFADALPHALSSGWYFDCRL